jgi:predicted TPR repeat methyltransferase
MAAIYEQQGAIDAAIKAYTILARLHPEQRTAYEEKIAMLRQRRGQ